MRIFGLKPMSTWDRASNLIKIINESSSRLERTSTGGYKYRVPAEEITSSIERYSLLQKCLPKAKEEVGSKLDIKKG